MHRALPDFKATLHQRGFRATPGRIRLLEALWASSRPLSVDTLARSVGLNVVTVYRALNDLVGSSLVVRGLGQSGHLSTARFSYAKKHHHHHLVCRDCGFIQTCAHCH